MELVFAHDHKLRKINGKYYTVGGLRDSITERYLEFFDKITIFCRAIEKQPYDTQLFELKNSSIQIKPVSNGSLLLSKYAKKMMENEIKNADGLIVKLHSKIAEHAISYARKYNIPYLVEVVGCPWDAYWNHSLKGKFVAPFMTFSTKKEIKRAPFVIYVTKNFLEKRYPTDGYWIDCSDVELSKIEEQVLEKRLKKIEEMKNIFTIGTLAQVDVFYKGQEYVIRALEKLKNRGKIFKYKLAGSGDPTRLKKVAEKYNVADLIEFCGTLSHEEVFNWLDNLDYYIQPSKQEGLSRSLIEAISRGCPVAASNVGGNNELVENNYLFKAGDINSIVNILDKINKESLVIQAKINFEKAKNYDKKYLDNKRRNFYMDFASYCYKNKS